LLVRRDGDRRVRGWQRFGGDLAALGLCMLCAACGNGIDALATNAASSGLPSLPPAELTGVIFEGYRGELRDLSVTAQKARVDMVARTADLQDVKLSFSEGTRGRIEVAAPVGEFKLDGDDFELRGGVVGSAQEGERFATDEVRYVAAKRELVSATPVELRRSNLVLRADGMKLGLEQRRLRLIGAVQARVVPR
jgi:LPS export ABC transporter protein LptC